MRNRMENSEIISLYGLTDGVLNSIMKVADWESVILADGVV